MVSPFASPARLGRVSVVACSEDVDHEGSRPVLVQPGRAGGRAEALSSHQNVLGLFDAGGRRQGHAEALAGVAGVPIGQRHGRRQRKRGGHALVVGRQRRRGTGIAIRGADALMVGHWRKRHAAQDAPGGRHPPERGSAGHRCSVESTRCTCRSPHASKRDRSLTGIGRTRPRPRCHHSTPRSEAVPPPASSHRPCRSHRWPHWPALPRREASCANVVSPTDTRTTASATKTRETVSPTNTREAVVTLALGEPDMGWLQQEWEPVDRPVNQG
jgi:hypothetical protein